MRLPLAPAAALLLGCFVLGASGCAPCPAPTPVAAASHLVPCAPAVPASSQATAPASPPEQPTASRENPCLRGATALPAAPLAKAPPPVPQARCRRVERGLLARVERTLLRGYEPYLSPSRIYVDFGCDPVAAEPTEIDYETGSAHGAALTSYWLRRVGSPSATEYELWGVAYGWDYDPAGQTDPYKKGAAFRVRFAHEMLPGPATLRELDEIRLAAASSVREIPFTLAPGQRRARASFRTVDFHERLRIADADGNALAREFTGYASSDTQGARLPMLVARDGLERLLGEVSFAEGAGSPEHARLFRARFVEAFTGELEWHVAERLLALASRLGGHELVPALVAWLAREPAGEAGAQRRQVLALNALAVITGYDLRYANDGAVVPPAEAAAAYLAACRP